MMSRRKISYHHRIILALLLLSVVFYIPYMIIMYTSMTSKIKETLTVSNEAHLNQIYLDFDKSKTTLSQQAYSIYAGSTMQQLLYGNETGIVATSELKNIDRSISALESSIYSIGFYNAGLNEYHASLPTTADNSLDFISQQDSVEKLSPIFRTMQLPYPAGETVYLLSYVMYEYRMTPRKPSSFVIINQDVNSLLNELQNSAYAERTQADVFLISKEYGVCGTAQNIAQEDMAEFVETFTANKDTVSSLGTMTLSAGGNEFFVSWTSLSEETVDVVILQPKSVVFASLSEMHTLFFILLAVGVVVYLIVIYFLSKSLYRPVETLSNHIQELNGPGSVNKDINEFEQFKVVYASFATMKQKYYLRYMVDQTLTNSSESVTASFAASFPNHWLLAIPQRLVALITVESPALSAPSQESALDLYAVQNISEELLSESFCLETLQTDSRHLVVVLGSDGNWSSLYAKFNKIKKSIDHFFDFTISVYCSDPVTDLEQLSCAYQQVCVMETYAPMFGTGKILSPDAIEENLNNPAISYSQAALNGLTAALTSRSSDKIHTALQTLCAETKKLSIQNLWLCISLLINHARNVLQELSATATTAQTPGFMKQLPQILNEFTTVDTFFGRLEQILVTAVCDSGRASKGSDKNTLFLQNIEAYIAEHYQDSQLSPQQIADCFDVSVNYLPRKFQTLSGMSLSSYILQVRMQQAAKLLLENELPISEIAFQVGIENESYFYKLFKKYFGCTPKEYKFRQREL